MHLKQQYKMWLTDEVEKFSRVPISQAHKLVTKKADSPEYWQCYSVWIKLNRFIVNISEGQD